MTAKHDLEGKLGTVEFTKLHSEVAWKLEEGLIWVPDDQANLVTETAKLNGWDEGTHGVTRDENGNLWVSSDALFERIADRVQKLAEERGLI